MSSRFEQIIDEIEDYIEGCKFQPLSNTKILVEKERLMDLLDDLRTKTPDEVKRYQKIISNKEAILEDARKKADALLAETKVQTENMLSEHEIMQQAYAQANQVINNAQIKAQQIVDDATTEANEVKQAAMQYTDDSLARIQGIVVHAIDTANSKYGALLEQLKECETVINTDRAALYPQVSLENDIESLNDDFDEDDDMPMTNQRTSQGQNMNLRMNKPAMGSNNSANKGKLTLL